MDLSSVISRANTPESMASDETFLQEEAKFGVPCGNMKSSILVPNTVELEIALKMEPFDVGRLQARTRNHAT